MKERNFDEMIAYFNRRVSEMDIAQDYKMELLGMVAALGDKHGKTAQQWIPCSERLPECEQEVLICTKKKIYISKNSGLEWLEEPIITPALYEDGTMLEVNSKWRWEDIDYAGWDEEEDCGIIPEGWWENRHFNPDDVYNNVVDREVVAWMPLPEPYNKDNFSQHMNPPEG